MRNPRPPTPAQRRALVRRLGHGLRHNVPLADKTTFRIGGPAELYFEATTVEALATAVRAARDLDIDYFLLGSGANILISDRGFAGLVIANQATAFSIRGTRLRAASGALIYPDLIEAAIRRGLSGLEHYAGIPSTVGGALWQNLHFLSPAPARERTLFIEEILESAEIMTATNERRTVDVHYFDFGYDQSVLHGGEDIVLDATFELESANSEALARVVEENLRWRAERHPPLTIEPSAGSIFRKIEGIGAGRLIDEVGLKGLILGGAQISPRHANIIINRDHASAGDVRALIGHIQETVNQATGYWLTPEISFVGNFTETWPKRRPALA